MNRLVGEQTTARPGQRVDGRPNQCVDGHPNGRPNEHVGTREHVPEPALMEARQ